MYQFMKRLSLVLVGIIFSLSSFSLSKDSLNAITMVSYEQSWLDSQGRISLKNNTEEEIRNVIFVLTYLDMSGTALDYEEFSREVVIAPGKTKQLDISAYERGRDYSYYKSEAALRNPKQFKVEFELKGYNKDEKPTSISIDRNDSFDDIIAPLLAILLVFFVLGIFIGSYVLVGVMAKKRHRNVALWILLSLIATPLLIIIILLCVGSENRRNEYEL